MPVLKEFVKADYPAALVKKGIEGTVLLDVVVNDSGRVDSVAVVKGLYPALDSAAAKAAVKFVFSPATAGGKPVAVLLQYAYRFTISEVVTKIDEFTNLKGRLYERGTRTPLQNATVMVSFEDTLSDTTLSVPFSTYLKKIGAFKGQYLSSGSIITTSDSTGYFEFKSLPACTVYVKTVIPDFEIFMDRLVLKHGEASDVIYRLQRVSEGDNEIVVYGKAEKKEVAQRTLTLNEVTKIPGLGGDAVKVVQTMPGVARAAFYSGAIIIRGSGTNDSHFYIDGVTIPVLFHFGGIKSTYNSDALSSVDLYPGGFGTRYGNAIGGVVELKGREAKTDRIHGYVDVNLYDATLMAEGPISDKLSFIIAGRRSYITDALDLGLQLLKIKLPFTVAPYYWDYLARMDYKISKTQHAYVTLFGSSDKLDVVINQARGGGSSEISSSSNSIGSETTFHLGIAGWEWEINNKFKNDFRYALCNLYEKTSAMAEFQQEGHALAHYVRDEFNFTASPTLKWSLGADIQIIPYNLVMASGANTNAIVHDTAHYNFGPYAAYLFCEYKPTQKLTLIPGFRYDYYPELIYKGSIIPEFWDYTSFNNNRGISGEPSLRVTARYALDKINTLKASAGNYNNTPQPQGQAIDPKWGTPTLPAQKASQYVVGYERKISDLISADVQSYFNEQWDLALAPSDTEIAHDPSLKSVHYLSNGKARMGGIELLLKHEQGKHFFGWLSYSLSRSVRWNYDENQWVIYSQDQTNILQLIGSYKFAYSQEFGVRFQYVTGDPTTPILGPDYFDATNRRYVALYGPLNSGRVAPYVSLDFRYAKTFTFNLWQLDAYIEVTHLENWFDKGYKSPETGQYQWNYDFTDKNVLSDVTRPSIGVKVSF
jgi:TonB family protein